MPISVVFKHLIAMKIKKFLSVWIRFIPISALLKILFIYIEVCIWNLVFLYIICEKYTSILNSPALMIYKLSKNLEN